MFRNIVMTGALLSSLVLWGAEYTVYFTPSWVDGRATSSPDDPSFITEKNSTNGADWFKFTSGKTYTFKAIVPKGHDVTKWSYDTYSQQTVINARASGGFKNVKVTSPVDTFVWESIKAGGQSLAVHLDWLKYTISYEGNGATSGAGTVQTGLVYNSPVTLNANPFSKTGYGFTGWAVKNESSKTFGDRASVKGEDFDNLTYTNKFVTLQAQWKANTYDVTFDANGGKFTNEEVTRTLPKVYDQKYGELPTDVSLFSYRFDGWTNVAGVVVTSDTILKTAANHTLYAKWTWVPQQHTVTFDPGVAVATPSFSTKTVTYTQSYGDLPTIAAEGYEFQGWYTQKTGGTEVTKTSTVSTDEDHTLYAHWLAQEYKLVYNPDGGTVKIGWETVTYGKYYERLETPVRLGYTFGGWYTEREGGDKIQEGDRVTIVRDTNVYARWTANGYSVTFDANGGTGETMNALSLQYDEAMKLPACTYVNGDRSFMGWIGPDSRTFKDQAVVSNLTSIAGGEYKLTACWSDDYTIAFDGNGATNVVMESQRLLTTETAPLSSNLYERVGYTYRGWATNTEDAVEQKVSYADGEEVCGIGQAGETVCLYAVWTNNLYRVRFYPNGGAGTVTEKTCAYDVEFKLPGGETFSREGYELTGWLTDPTNVVALEITQPVSNLTSSSGIVIPLYAKWSAATPALSDLALAADSNVNLTANPVEGCTIESEKGYSEGNDTCVQLMPQGDSNAQNELRLEVSGTGTLSFWFKENFDDTWADYIDEYAHFYVWKDGGQFWEGRPLVSREWEKSPTFVISNVQSTISLAVVVAAGNAGLKYAVRLDGISWVPDQSTVGVTFRRNDGTPAPADIVTNVTLDAGKPIGALPVLADEDWLGWSTTAGGAAIDATWIVPATDTQLYALWKTSEHPVPSPEDAPTISGFAAAADGFSLSCTSDNRFDYRLLSTLSLVAPIKWEPTGELQQGTGEALNFTIPVESTDPMKFFRVEVLQRGTK